MQRKNRSGFTLVELSIVLVIIGLLTGGVLSGQSLIRAAELKAVTTEFNKYTAAVQTFRDKYQALPGDMRNATAFWGFQGTTAAPACASNATPAVATVSATGVCDGNGNGNIDNPALGGQTGDMFQFWRHLASAGLIEGTYTGISDGALIQHTIGKNAPRSKLTNAGWEIEYLPNLTNNTVFYDYDYGNAFIFGAQPAAWDLVQTILKPEEAWNIDSKIDDGRPHSGKTLAGRYDTCATKADGTAAASNDPATDVYKLTDSGADCILIFAKPF